MNKRSASWGLRPLRNPGRRAGFMAMLARRVPCAIFQHGMPNTVQPRMNPMPLKHANKAAAPMSAVHACAGAWGKAFLTPSLRIPRYV